MAKKVTIIDVANRAGVSKGTVDRVLHNRGEVARKSAEKVHRAIEELGFKPNLHASLLASRKAQTIACLMPEFEKGEYWEALYDGFLQGAAEVGNLNVKVKVYRYAQYDASSFKAVCAEVLASEPDGAVLVPLFGAESRDFVHQLTDREIPYVYVDHRLEGDEDYFAYIGMPMYRSGKLCAYLLTERCSRDEVDDVVLVRIRRDVAGKSDPSQARRAGFFDFMEEHFPDAKIHTIHIDPADPDGSCAALKHFFAELPPVKFIAMLNSRVHLLGGFLSGNKLQGCRVAAFDNLDRNIGLLKSGLVDVLVAQHTEEQSRSAVLCLADCLVMQKCPDLRDTYMHMDILTRMNIDNY